MTMTMTTIIQIWYFVLAIIFCHIITHFFLCIIKLSRAHLISMHWTGGDCCLADIGFDRCAFLLLLLSAAAYHSRLYVPLILFCASYFQHNLLLNITLFLMCLSSKSFIISFYDYLISSSSSISMTDLASTKLMDWNTMYVTQRFNFFTLRWTTLT